MRRFAGVGLVWGSLFSALSMAASCYRAQIDLTPLVDDLPSAGASGAAGDAGGAAANVDCDRAPLDAVQEQCHSVFKPTAADCHEADPAGWDGCYAGGCAVCSEKFSDFPHYLDWHPCCEANPTCNRNLPVTCNVRCPAPTEHDKIAPCFAILR